MNGMLTGVRLDGMNVGRTYGNFANSFSLGSFDLGAMSSSKRFEWVTANLDTVAAVNIELLRTLISAQFNSAS